MSAPDTTRTCDPRFQESDNSLGSVILSNKAHHDLQKSQIPSRMTSGAGGRFPNELYERLRLYPFS
jgi:hypothetical protein